MSEDVVRKTWRRSFFQVGLLVLTAIIAMGAMVAPLVSSYLTPSLQVGQVAAQDYRAPRSTTYTSQVLTDERRELAARNVSPVYTRPDTSIARQQLERLRASLAYINSVREDQFASQTQKLDDLAALEDLHLDSETGTTILALSDSRWQVVQQEAIAVLEQVMRSTIRSDRLDDARSNVPTLVSLALPEQQADIVAKLVSAFVIPNSLYSEDLTEAARQRARDAITPVTQSFLVGQTVVQRGRVLTAADVEALQELGLGKPQQRWQDPAAAAGLALLMLVFLVMYLQKQPPLPHEVRSLSLLASIFLAFLLTARVSIPGHTLVPYAFPVPAYALVVAALFGPQLALLTSLPLAVMVAYNHPAALELTVFYSVASYFGVLVLGRARRLTSFFWAGVAIALAGSAVTLIYRLPLPTTDLLGLASLVGAALFNGLASASITVLMQFFLAQFLGLTTPLQLMELTRPDHQLLQLVLREAPGTYQHSLQVANLAEQAAEKIGADPLLTRVGALYHDCGKALNPVFFIENQVPGFPNPHDELDPLASSMTIIRHVTDGLELARKYRLPRRILDFIAEHHGTMITRYQYVNAVKAAGGDESEVDEELFRYPGPKPRSKETAIIMLADGCEARMRAERPKDEQEMYSLIHGTIDNRVSIGQLDDTDLTLMDLKVIAESFQATMKGVYHPRVKYPQLESLAAAESVPTQPASSSSRQPSDVPVSSAGHSFLPE
jgi:putative nucleotidyltransferase with HDIG domain